MSAATTFAHLSYTPHPLPLREQAFTLHCQGLRSPAISEELDVPERTIRAWIAAALKDLADDHRISRHEQLLLAVERQHALTVAAWQEFECEVAARHALLDAALHPTPAAFATPSDSAAAGHDDSAAPVTPPAVPRLPATTPAPRYLSLILQAQKETNRLLGLYQLARLEVLHPDPAPALPDTPLTEEDADPTLAAHGEELDVRSHSPAESATAPDSPLPAGEGLGVRFPAEDEGEYRPARRSSAKRDARRDVPAEYDTSGRAPDASGLVTPLLT